MFRLSHEGPISSAYVSKIKAYPWVGLHMEWFRVITILDPEPDPDLFLNNGFGSRYGSNSEHILLIPNLVLIEGSKPGLVRG